LWIGTDKKGLWIFDVLGKNEYVRTRKAPISAETINALYSPGSTHLWLGTFDKGLVCMDLQTLEKTKLPPLLQDCQELKETSVLNFYEDSYNRIWICTNGNGLFLYDYKNQKLRRFH
jgi:ligand-binding sensor domain-containing protein